MIQRPVTHLPNTCKSTDYATISSGRHLSGQSRPQAQITQNEHFTTYRGKPSELQGVSPSKNLNYYHQAEVASPVSVTAQPLLGIEALNKRNNQASATIGICFLNSMDAEAYAEKLNGTGSYQVIAVSHTDIAKADVVAILADHCLREMENTIAPIFRITRGDFQPCSCCRNISSHSGWSELLHQIEIAIQHPSLNGAQVEKLSSNRMPPFRSTHAARRGLPPELDSLTKRELDVLQLVGQGMSVRDMAEHLQLAESTVGNHKYRLMKKLEAKTSLELLRISVRCGLSDLA